MPVARIAVTLRQQWLTGRPIARRFRLVALVLLGVTVLIAGLIVFTPGAPAAGGQSVLHRWSALWRASGAQPRFLTFESIEWGANLVMFLPIGFLFAGTVRPGRRFWAVPAAAAGSVVIEVAQLFVPGRVSSVSDVTANTTGALIGVWALVAVSERWSHLRHPAGGSR